MNFITAGFDELERKLQRAAGRFRIWQEQRRLTKAEINLGALGWQQVEDFPPEIAEQMRAITAMERQQAELSNQGADLQWNIAELQKQLDKTRGDHNELIVAHEAELQPLKESRDSSAAPIEDRKESIARFDSAIAEMEKAADALGVRLRSLLSLEKQSIQIKEEIINITEKRASFENEKEDLQRSRMRAYADLKAITDHIGATDAQIAQMHQRIRQIHDEFNVQEKDLLAQIAHLENEKENASKHVRTLDQKKSPAFRAIGRCLADSGISPMNQPQALERVLALKENIDVSQQRIATSLARSSQVNPATMAAFYAVLLLILALFVIAGIFLFKAHPQP